MAKVVSVNISEKKGTLKRAVPEIKLKLRHGIVGDAHAGDWHRQISLLAEESIDTEDTENGTASKEAQDDMQDDTQG